MSRFDKLLERFATLIQATPRAVPIEGLPGLPNLYALLVERYSFRAFALGPISFFGTDGDAFLFPRAALADAGLARVLSRHSYVQIGRPPNHSYDPVCLEISGRRDGALVRLDHEDILLRERIRVIEVVAPSFMDFMERALAGQFGEPTDAED